MQKIIQFFKSKEITKAGYYILGVANLKIIETLLSKTNKIVISEQTIIKNINHHKDLTLKDYENLCKIIGNFDILIKDGQYTVGIVNYQFSNYYYTLKSTKSGNTIFLTSFRKTSQHDIKRLKNKLLKGKIEIIQGKL